MEYKNQHFVSQSYIKAWLDPETPNNGAFVWIVSKEGHLIKRKSPRSLFAEEDFYTVYDSDGERILNLEHKLSSIESKFIQLRNQKLQNYIALTPEDRKTIALFVSTTFARTKRLKEEKQLIWKEYSDYIENLPPELSQEIKLTGEYKYIKKSREIQPMPYQLFHFVDIAANFLYRMRSEILDTQIKPGFITSDNPCFIFEPAMYTSSPPYSWHALFRSPTVEFILPISPKQTIRLSWNGFDGYTSLSTTTTEEDTVNAINNFTATNCDEFIVVNQNSFRKDWFLLA